MTTNALVPAGGNALANYSGSDPYAAAAREMGGGQGQGSYLSFSGKSGRYSVKQTEIQSDQRFVFHPDDTERGAICWVSGKVIAETMVNIMSGQVAPTADKMEKGQSYGPYRQVAQGDQPDGWIDQASIHLTHADTGEEYIFKTTSKSGNLAIANLLAEYGKKRMFNAGKMPVVTNASTQFKPKDKNYYVYAPSLKIVEWLDEQEIVQGGAPEDYEQGYAELDQAGQVEDATHVEQEPVKQAVPVQQHRPAPAAAAPRPAPPAAAQRPVPPMSAGTVAQRPMAPRPRNLG